MCKAITKKGKVCKKRSMNDSDYCYMHSFGQVKNIPIWKNATFHFIVTIILAITIFCIQFFSGPSKGNQEVIINKVGNIEKIFKDYISSNQIDYNRMLEKYPSGFLLFGTNYDGIITAPSSHLLDDYEFNLSNVNIKFLEDNMISMLLPDITYKPASVSFQNNIFYFPVGSPGDIISYPYYSSHFPDDIYIEIMANNSNGIIFCIGFRKKSLRKLLS